MSIRSYNKEHIDKYRDVLVGWEDWSEHIQQDFKEDMLKIGIAVEQIFYSLHGGQGDGVSYEGHISDWGLYLLHLGYDDPILHRLASLNWNLVWKQSGRYTNERSVTYDDDIWYGINPYDEDETPIRHDTWRNVMNTFDLLGISEEIKEDLRRGMKGLYIKLLEEYDHLTSDEVVSEWMNSNNIELTELEN